MARIVIWKNGRRRVRRARDGELPDLEQAAARELRRTERRAQRVVGIRNLENKIGMSIDEIREALNDHEDEE